MVELVSEQPEETNEPPARRKLPKLSASIWTKMAVALIVVVSVIFALNHTNGRYTPPPRLFAHTADGPQAELMHLSMTWDYGSRWRPGVDVGHINVVNIGQESYEFLLSISNWDEMTALAIEHPDFVPLQITVSAQQILMLSTQKDRIVSGYDGVLSYVVWRVDGTVYDEGRRELITMTDAGVILLTMPYDSGEYIYDVILEFRRGTVQYAFVVVIE